MMSELLAHPEDHGEKTWRLSKFRLMYNYGMETSLRLLREQRLPEECSVDVAVKKISSS